ncbi:ankyrin repeat protein [Halobacteriovorax sp. BALOs_7]|uniref:ankyrin repeat domain-containing protein n=1 Tax=Halobacteriovorax sp. BALOs_7 TaxID=2109558 RepID=UPI000EA1F94C|nr:ankyrin repeat domain-containing protein [Halobacteriovorax sp. BALOs_7]AYF43533.1 ankyrin repeat protein [Halobacteriovorax sp. BALOs_7]
MSQLRILTLLTILVSCGSLEQYGDLLPLNKAESNEMLLSETEEAEYRYLADLYGLSEEELRIKDDKPKRVVQTEKDWDLEQVNLNEIENTSFIINDYEVTFVEDKFKHERQLVEEAKASEARKSRGIASIPEVSEVHKKRRPASLFAMAKKSTPESIRYIVKKKGLDVNKKNGQGDTPLHIALKNNRFENVRALLRLKADPNIPDASGKSVAQYAQEMELNSILKLINRR